MLNPQLTAAGGAYKRWKRFLRKNEVNII